MYLQNLHTHSTFCDGKNTLSEMCERAVEVGFQSIGFSRHANMPWNSPFTHPEMLPEYFETANRLREEFDGRLDVFCGAEFDAYSVEDTAPYDYIITSVHYMDIEGELVGFDRKPLEVKEVVDRYFGGDGLAFAKRAYAECAKIGTFKTDIVGHFDLVTKHAKTLSLFDEDSKEYKAIAIEAVRALSERVKIFELNTGCVPRGYRDNPYLAPFILKELKRLDCQICITSDCHDKRYFDSSYDDARKRLLDCGYKSIVVLTRDGFREEGII